MQIDKITVYPKYDESPKGFPYYEIRSWVIVERNGKKWRQLVITRTHQKESLAYSENDIREITKAKFELDVLDLLEYGVYSENPIVSDRTGEPLQILIN